MKHSSSIVTPSQTKVCEEILQRSPMKAPFWISTKAPMRDPSPTSQPYRFTSVGWKMVTFPFSFTLSEIGMSQVSTRPFAVIVSKDGAGFDEPRDEVRCRKSPVTRASLWLTSYDGVTELDTAFS